MLPRLPLISTNVSNFIVSGKYGKKENMEDKRHCNPVKFYVIKGLA